MKLAPGAQETPSNTAHLVNMVRAPTLENHHQERPARIVRLAMPVNSLTAVLDVQQAGSAVRAVLSHVSLTARQTTKVRSAPPVRSARWAPLPRPRAAQDTSVLIGAPLPVKVYAMPDITAAVDQNKQGKIDAMLAITVQQVLINNMNAPLVHTMKVKVPQRSAIALNALKESFVTK